MQDDLRVLVVAGRGRAFCAGNDIKEMEAVTPEDAEALARRHATIMARFTTLPQVTIAAVDDVQEPGDPVRRWKTECDLRKPEARPV